MKTKRKKSSGHVMTDEERKIRKKTNMLLQRIVLAMKKGQNVVDICMIWQVDVDVCKILVELDKQIKKNLPVLDYEIQLDCKLGSEQLDWKIDFAQLLIRNPQECFVEMARKPCKKTPEQLSAEWRVKKYKHCLKKERRKKIQMI